jgi:hypothetical protein
MIRSVAMKMIRFLALFGLGWGVLSGCALGTRQVVVPPLAAQTLETLAEGALEVAPPPAIITATISGVTAVDALIPVMLTNDLLTRRELVQLNTQGCTTAEGLGGPPKCAVGVADGTPVTFFPVLGPGEGSPVLPDALDSVLDFEVTAVTAIYLVSPDVYQEAAYPAGEYGIVFATAPDGFPVTARVLDGKIVRLDFAAWPMADELVQVQGEIIWQAEP